MTCEKVKDAAEFAPVAFNLVPVAGSVVPVETSAGVIQPPARQILALLRDAFRSERPSTTRLQQASGMAPSTFYDHWRVLQARGLVADGGAGKTTAWTVSEAGHALLDSEHSGATPDRHPQYSDALSGSVGPEGGVVTPESEPSSNGQPPTLDLDQQPTGPYDPGAPT